MGIKDLFDNTPAAETNGNGATKKEMDTVPDGVYQAEVTDFSVFASRAGDYYVRWWFEVTTGPASGAQLRRFTSVTDRSVGVIKSTVKKVAGDVPKWSDLFEDGRTGRIYDDIVGKNVEIVQRTNKKNNKSYINIYVNKLIDPPANNEAGEEVDVNDLF
tara:strand:+ start:2517 stop:2993 length:477 start_codon:yes stop_codon:yes gene_type:complete